MKPKSALLRFLVLAASSLLAVSSASAVTYYWDGNDSTTGFGTAGGTWADPTAGTLTSGWSTDSTGASAAGGVLAWLRYHHVLESTELAAQLATCPHCGTYGRLAVVRSVPQSEAAVAANPRLEDLPHLRWRCRRCEGEWRLEPPQ